MAANTHALDLESTSSQYAGIADASQTGLDITGNMTIEAYVKVESAPGADSDYVLVAKFRADNNQRAYSFNYRDVGGVKKLALFISTDGAGNTIAQVNQTLTPGTYYHVAAVYDAAAGSAEFFVNGASIGSASGLSTSIFNSSADFQIGSQITGGGSQANFYDGLIDEARIWNIKRTGAQMLTNYQRDVSGQANLQGYWKLNNDYTDSSPNGNTLTASGSPVFSTDVPFSPYVTDVSADNSFFYFM